MRQTKRFCDEHGIPYRTPGKLLVATSEAEVARMEALFERSQENRTDVRRVSAAELRELEPNVEGLGALLVAETGIVDYRRVTETMADLIRAAGAEIVLGEPVVALRETDASVEVDLPGRGITARRLVVCAGLQADRLARMAGLDVDLQIVPFRGEYYRLPPERAGLVERLIYPIPDPDLPFLGVHLSPTIHGDLTVGPNAVLGFAREGYPRFSVDLRDVATYAAFPGLWRVARSNVRTGLREMRNSLWRRGYLAECRTYCPSLTLADLLPQEAGIRAQAVQRDGTLVHDFVLREAARSVHVLNAPSPAATSALPIGSMIADQVRALG
jgi:L-2-hydroxyglutarate oxidase